MTGSGPRAGKRIPSLILVHFNYTAGKLPTLLMGGWASMKFSKHKSLISITGAPMDQSLGEFYLITTLKHKGIKWLQSVSSPRRHDHVTPPSNRDRHFMIDIASPFSTSAFSDTRQLAYSKTECISFAIGWRIWQVWGRAVRRALCSCICLSSVETSQEK